MATIIKNTNKKGAISFNIRVSCGYNYEGKQILKQMTWHPDPSLTPKQAEKQAQLESYGKDGWELVSRNADLCTFKRPKEK